MKEKKAFKSRQNKIWHYCLKEQPVDTNIFFFKEDRGQTPLSLKNRTLSTSVVSQAAFTTCRQSSFTRTLSRSFTKHLSRKHPPHLSPPHKNSHRMFKWHSFKPRKDVTWKPSSRISAFLCSLPRNASSTRPTKNKRHINIAPTCPHASLRMRHGYTGEKPR